MLERQYDFVISQDVIEHAPDIATFLEEISTLVRPKGGKIAIGTPDAANIRLKDPVDIAGQLHQPYHRHLLTKAQLEKMIASNGFEITNSLRTWYVDTWFPFLNSSFLFNYVVASGGAIDSTFEPVNFGLVLSSPRLLFLGLFGRLLRPQKDMLIFATAP